MATRLSRYASSYSANVRAVERFKSIQDTVKDEQDRQAAVQSYLVAERSNLTNLEQVFAARPSQDGLATEILKQTMAADAAAFRKQSAANAAGTRAKGVVPKDIVDAVEAAKKLPDGNRVDALRKLAVTATNRLGTSGKGALPKADADALLSYLRAIGVPKAEVAKAEKAAAGVTERPAIKAGAKAPTAEEQAADKGLKAATEAIYFGSPQGYAGGFDGEAIAQAREKTVAPEGSKFATGDEAYKAYLSMLDDGYASADEMAAITGQEDPDIAANEFKFAEELYRQAKINKAYTNADRKYFEPTWIDQAKRITDLANEYAETKKSYGGRTPTQEAAYRELKARGIDPDDPHAQYAGTPTHGYLTEADRIYGQTIGAGSKLVPSTYVQKKTAALIDQYAASGTEWKVKDIEKQLGKAFEGKNLSDAVAFALAYDRVKTEGATPESQAALQVEEEKRKANAARENEAKLKKLEEEEVAARASQKRTEQQLGSAMRNEDANERARVEYNRQRALGKSEEEARAIALPLIPRIVRDGPIVISSPPDEAPVEAPRRHRITMPTTVITGTVPDVIGPPPVEAPVTSPPRRRKVSTPTPAITGTVPTAAPAAPTAPAVKESTRMKEALQRNVAAGKVKLDSAEWNHALDLIEAQEAREGK